MQVILPKGLSDLQIKQAMSEVGASSARVLHLEGVEAAFGGFEGSRDADQFNTVIYGHLLGGWSATWCAVASARTACIAPACMPWPRTLHAPKALPNAHAKRVRCKHPPFSFPASASPT